MFYYIEGNVAVLEPFVAVIDCGGVGYKCNVTAYTRSALKESVRARLYTYCYIREDMFEIFGFSTKAEKSCFEMLIGVSGVGPKAAISILSHSTPENLAMAIITGNEKALTVAPGIGKKIAQRIILELKDKMSKESGEIAGGTFVPAVGAKSGKASDATAALAVLGYTQSDISSALKNIDIDSMTLEDIIRSALKQMVK